MLLYFISGVLIGITWASVFYYWGDRRAAHQFARQHFGLED